MNNTLCAIFCRQYELCVSDQDEPAAVPGGSEKFPPGLQESPGAGDRRPARGLEHGLPGEHRYRYGRTNLLRVDSELARCCFVIRT